MKNNSHDILGPAPRPWTADYEEHTNQTGDTGGRPIILDACGKLVATFERTIDRDLAMQFANSHEDRWNTARYGQNENTANSLATPR